MILGHHVNIIDSAGRHHQVSLERLAEAIAERLGGRPLPPLIDAEPEPVDTPRAPPPTPANVETVLDSSGHVGTVQDISRQRAALVQVIAELGDTSSDQAVIDQLAEIAAAATAATTLAGLAAARERVEQIIAGGS